MSQFNLLTYNIYKKNNIFLYKCKQNTLSQLCFYIPIIFYLVKILPTNKLLRTFYSQALNIIFEKILLQFQLTWKNKSNKYIYHLKIVHCFSLFSCCCCTVYNYQSLLYKAYIQYSSVEYNTNYQTHSISIAAEKKMKKITTHLLAECAMPQLFHNEK